MHKTQTWIVDNIGSMMLVHFAPISPITNGKADFFMQKRTTDKMLKFQTKFACDYYKSQV